MKVKCIEKSKCCSPGSIVPKKGNVYNVKQIMESHRLDGTDNNIWYVLEETDIFHQHSSLFEIVEVTQYDLSNLFTILSRKIKMISSINDVIKSL